MKGWKESVDDRFRAIDDNTNDSIGRKYNYLRHSFSIK
jgi:hypothetical protein